MDPDGLTNDQAWREEFWWMAFHVAGYPGGGAGPRHGLAPRGARRRGSGGGTTGSRGAARRRPARLLGIGGGVGERGRRHVRELVHGRRAVREERLVRVLVDRRRAALIAAL